MENVIIMVNFEHVSFNSPVKMKNKNCVWSTNYVMLCHLAIFGGYLDVFFFFEYFLTEKIIDRLINVKKIVNLNLATINCLNSECA